MPNYYQNERVLAVKGYEIYFTRFSDSIIADHFKQAEAELAKVLENFYIDPAQIIKGGGGLSTITQTLAGLLYESGWKKAIIESQHRVKDRILTSESHEVDHYKCFEQGNIGLEIEWNNKDPFYDRDLENFRKLHQIGEMSIGIIITRGATLQTELAYVIRAFLRHLYPFDLPKLLGNISLSDGAKIAVKKLLELPQEEAINRIAAVIYNSKYGAATTHMKKLQVRLDRGVGNPCPLILIGIGKERLRP